MQSPVSPPELHYAPAPSRLRRKGFRRAVILLTLAGVACFAWWRWGPAVRERVTLLMAQRQCAAYVAPTDHLISTEPLPVLWETSFTQTAGDPQCLADLMGYLPADVPGNRLGGPVLFLHARKTTSGVERIVVLRRTPPQRRMSIDIPLAYTVTLIEAAAAREGKPVQKTFIVEEVLDPIYDDAAAEPALRFFAGQPDASDPARFTVAYEITGRRGAIEGRLVDTDSDGPTVELKLLD